MTAKSKDVEPYHIEMSVAKFQADVIRQANARKLWMVEKNIVNHQQQRCRANQMSRHQILGTGDQQSWAHLMNGLGVP